MARNITHEEIEKTSNLLEENEKDLGTTFEKEISTYTDANGEVPDSIYLSTLQKVVLDLRLRKAKFNYKLINYFPFNIVSNGIFRALYSNYTDGDNSEGTSDVIIDDFNAEIEPTIYEDVKAIEPWHKKNKIMWNPVMDATATATQALEIINLNNESNSKAIMKKLETTLWNMIFDNGTLLPLKKATTIGVMKEIYNQLFKYQTTKINHIGVGDGQGKIEITYPDGTTQELTPEETYNSKDFILITTPEYNTNIVFNGKATFFNFEATSMELFASVVIDFNDGYSPLDASAGFTATIPDNTQAILIHKDFLSLFGQYQLSKLMDTPKLYSILHNYIKYGAYAWKDVPCLIITNDGIKTPAEVKE